MARNGDRFDRERTGSGTTLGRHSRAAVGPLHASLFGRVGAIVRGVLPGESTDGVDDGGGAADAGSVPAGDVRWAFAVVGDATHVSDQLDETASVAAAALSATTAVFRPTGVTLALAGYRGDGGVDRVFPSHDAFRQPADTAEIDRDAPASPSAEWIAGTAREASLAGDLRACLRCDVAGESRVDGRWRSGALSMTIKPEPAPETFPGDAAYRLRVVGDGPTWLDGDPDDRRRLARAFEAIRDRIPVANATTDGGDRAEALLA